jgi:hypothetical protein
VKALTANDLLTGDTVFWAHGQWVEYFGDAEIFDGEDADRALHLAEAQLTRVVGPYLFDVQETPLGPAPVAYRERLRALGPSNHTQHGKQAEVSETEIEVLSEVSPRSRSTGRLSLISRSAEEH